MPADPSHPVPARDRRPSGCSDAAEVAVFEAVSAALSTLSPLIEAARQFHNEVEQIRSGIFYWMTRNHNRGEKSYVVLGQAKEQLTAAIKKYDDALGSLSTFPAPASPLLERWRHKKSGTIYEVLGTARAQVEGDILEDDLVVVYRAEADGKLWVRPTEDFYDGRFKRLPAPPATSDGGE